MDVPLRCLLIVLLIVASIQRSRILSFSQVQDGGHVLRRQNNFVPLYFYSLPSSIRISSKICTWEMGAQEKEEKDVRELHTYIHVSCIYILHICYVFK